MNQPAENKPHHILKQPVPIEPPTALVQLKDITKTYGSGQNRFTAISRINFDVAVGELVALLGPSGCGKSTLLRIITGLIAPTAGQVLYQGKILCGVNPHASIVFQTFALFPWLTVQDNVEVPLKARNMPPEKREEIALELLDRVGLSGFENAYPRELSGGMRQKVGFARAMAVEPELLCLDEPFSALDVLSAETLRGELLELWSSGKIPTKSILMVSHNIEEAVFMADRIVIMDKDPGRIVHQTLVEMPHPRQRKAPEYLNLVDRVYAILAGQTQPEAVEMGTAPGQPGITRHLPNLTINEITGLMDRMQAVPDHRVDIYRLAEDLHSASDYILKVIEGPELLGFVNITSGDMSLTPLGETFADASITARKEIFYSRIKRLPLFIWLLDMLKADPDKRLNYETVQMALSLELPKDEAETQLDIMINWGRYAELFTYDDNSGLINLAQEG